MAKRTVSLDIERLRRAAAHLPAVQREVLRLSAVELLSYERISDRLGISPEAVQSHLADALYSIGRHVQPRKRAWWRFW